MEYDLSCPRCGASALIPVGPTKSPIIAAIGLNLIFDEPSHKPDPSFMPDEIQCRNCRAIYEG